MKAWPTVLLFALSLYGTGRLACAVSGPDCSHGPEVVGKLEDGSPIYMPTCGISPPRVVYQEEPEYSDKARKKKIQGTVELSAVVGADGNVHDVKIEHSAEASLDRQAVAALKKWKFKPATKDGEPVAVKLHTEMSFRLY